VDRNPQGPALTRQRLGERYVLGAEVGRGGMAVVHRAHDEVLDREVAVKLLHPHLATDPAFLERFRREARAAAGLAHPNIVAVHDWGEHDDGAFLVLQLVEGASLRDVLRRRGRLSPAEAMAVLVPAAAGLQAAHDAGIVHRDVKPENLLIGRDGSVRVTDFGLARAAAEATSTFGPDVLVGSPHYLAPEAVRGSALDPRADVYALGILLFECLVGHPPHIAETPYSTALAHVERAVPAPSSHVEGLAVGLDRVVAEATQRDRSTRTATAAALADALREAVGEGTEDPAVPTVGALGPPGPPHPPLSPQGAAPPVASQAPTGNGTAAVGRTLVVPLDDAHTEVVAAPAGRSVPPVQIPRRRATPAGGGADGTPGRTGSPPPSPTAPPSADAPPGQPRTRRRRWPLVVLLLLALVGGSTLGGYLLYDRVLAPVTPIPSVVGVPESSAVEQLDRAGFEPRIPGDPVHDATVPAGHVRAQEPQGAARTGTSVSLELSAGPRQVTVPDVTGAPAAEAVSQLTAAELATDEATSYDEQVPEGEVIASDPPPGSTVDEGTEVTLTISLGPTPIPVPALVGDDISAARAQLTELGLQLRVLERRYDADAAQGVILFQDPDPEAVRFAGDTVEVVVSDGPQPIELPNVRGDRVGEAVATLEALGFEVEVERRGGFSAFLNPDRVYDQDPGPGSTRLPGARIQLYAYEP